MLIADKYEVVEEVGRGGMGIVYCVRHLDLDTLFALKMIPRELSEDAEAVERFRREARVMAQLNHRHIARVFDLARDGRSYYLVMEFLPGRNLRHYLRDHLEGAGRALPPTEVVRIGAQVASALAYAHGRMPAIVHRDIKPSNIIMVEEGGDDPAQADAGDRAVVTDFGIAKLLGDAHVSLTSSGGFLGTLKYCAPEQMRRGLDVDGRADVYSLGVVLYELATGEQLCGGQTDQEIVARVLGGEPADVRALAGVDPALARIVTRATALERDDRHASALELLGDLQTCLRARTGGAPPPAAEVDPSSPAAAPADPEATPWFTRAASATSDTRSGTTGSLAARARDAPRRGLARRLAALGPWVGARAWAIALVLPALAIAVLCLAEGVAWIGRPFPGFLLLENRVVPTVAGYQWSGVAAGLPFHSTIVAVGGEPVTASETVYRAVEAVPVGATLTYTARKDGRRFDVAIPTQRFGLGDYALTFGLLSLNGVVILLMGLAVGLLSPHNRSARVFLVMTLMMGLYPLTGIDLYRAHRFPAAGHLLLQCMAPATFIHLATVFPVERRLAGLGRLAVAVPYLAGGVLTLLVVRSYWATPADLAPLYLAYVFSVVGLLVLIAAGLLAYVRHRRASVRGRVQVLLLGVVAAFLLPVVGFFDNAFGGGRFPINLIALTPIFFFVAVGYAIVRHRLFDAPLLIRRGVVYGALLTGFTALYVAAVSVLNQVLAGTDVARSPAFTGGFMAVSLALCLPLRDRLSAVIERRLFPHTHRFHRTLREVATAITGMVDRNAVLTHVMTTLADAVDATSGSVLLREDDDKSLRVTAAFGGVPPEYSIPGDAPLTRLLATTRSEIFADDLDEDPALEAVRTSCSAVLTTLHAELILPLVSESGLCGALTLGQLRGRTALTSEDLRVLRALGAALSVAVVRSRDAVRAERLAEQRRALRRHLPTRTAREAPGEAHDASSARWTHVTSLAVCLDGFLAFADRAGPEATTRLLRQYYAVCERVLREHLGTAERYDGPRVAATFDPSTAAADHPRRAARGAIAIRAALEHQRAAWRADGYELALRCGIATGFAHVGPPGHDGHRALGPTIELADGLRNLAEPGAILADPATAVELAGTMTCTPLGPRALPLLGRPLLVSRIEGEASA